MQARWLSQSCRPCTCAVPPRPSRYHARCCGAYVAGCAGSHRSSPASENDSQNQANANVWLALRFRLGNFTQSGLPGQLLTVHLSAGSAGAVPVAGSAAGGATAAARVQGRRRRQRPAAGRQADGGRRAAGGAAQPARLLQPRCGAAGKAARGRGGRKGGVSRAPTRGAHEHVVSTSAEFTCVLFPCADLHS